MEMEFDAISCRRARKLKCLRRRSRIEGKVPTSFSDILASNLPFSFASSFFSALHPVSSRLPASSYSSEPTPNSSFEFPLPRESIPPGALWGHCNFFIKRNVFRKGLALFDSLDPVEDIMS